MCVCVCVVSVIVKRPVLPPCVVDGRSRNPLYYYYYVWGAAVARGGRGRAWISCENRTEPLYLNSTDMVIEVLGFSE